MIHYYKHQSFYGVLNFVPPLKRWYILTQHKHLKRDFIQVADGVPVHNPSVSIVKQGKTLDEHIKRVDKWYSKRGKVNSIGFDVIEGNDTVRVIYSHRTDLSPMNFSKRICKAENDHFDNSRVQYIKLHSTDEDYLIALGHMLQDDLKYVSNIHKHSEVEIYYRIFSKQKLKGFQGVTTAFIKPVIRTTFVSPRYNLYEEHRSYVNVETLVYGSKNRKKYTK